jgi:putative tryptophan/tyrosine transport system substrate-binding protein
VGTRGEGLRRQVGLSDRAGTGLTDLGYIVGRNTIIEERFAEAKKERLPAMAADLVANRVERNKRKRNILATPPRSEPNSQL